MFINLLSMTEFKFYNTNLAIFVLTIYMYRALEKMEHRIEFFMLQMVYTNKCHISHFRHCSVFNAVIGRYKHIISYSKYQHYLI